MTKETNPRWSITIIPTANSEADAKVTATAPDVTSGELAFVLSKVVTLLARNPMQRIPTEAEVAAQIEAEKLAKEFPATQLFVKEKEQLWLGEKAISELDLKGWLNAGPVPAGVSRVCDYAKDAVRVKGLLEGAASSPVEQ